MRNYWMTFQKLILVAGVFCLIAASAPETEKKLNSDRDKGKGLAPYKAPPAGYSLANVQQWVSKHRATNPTFAYVYIPAEIAGDKTLTNIMRVALGKALNHLIWNQQIYIPVDVSDGHGLVFGLDKALFWSGADEFNWNAIAYCMPKAGVDISPADTTGCSPFDNNGPPAALGVNAAGGMGSSDNPANDNKIVPVQRFVFNAVNGGPYANIHKTPPDYDSFASAYQPGPIIAISTHRDAIVCGPRITAYRMVNVRGAQLLYSFTSDEFDGRDEGQINYTTAPTLGNLRYNGAFEAAPGNDGTAVATEWWMQMPNGFMYWGIHGEGSQERGRAEFPFAIDPANWNQGAELSTGRSCISCHVSGIQSAVSDKEFAGTGGWTSNEQLTKEIYTPVSDRFRVAMETVVGGLSDDKGDLNDKLIRGLIEPIKMAIMLVEGPYRGGNGTCESFCSGKFARKAQNACDVYPAR